jgi:chemotaxis family two-component system response regulator Rcp1
MMHDHVVHLLLVEDDDAHAMFVERSFVGGGGRATMDRVHDGVEAVAYVRRLGEFQNRPRPDLILLDLNLPRMNGHEVLRTFKADDDLKMIPVVILTTSDAEQDRRQAYGLHANGYLVKPTDFGQFRQMIGAVTSYWGVWNRPASESAG